MATWDEVRRLALALPETSESTSHGLADLGELIVEVWLVRAPKRVARSYLDGLGRTPGS